MLLEAQHAPGGRHCVEQPLPPLAAAAVEAEVQDGVVFRGVLVAVSSSRRSGDLHAVGMLQLQVVHCA
jgi:hypothetical protein